MATHSLSGTITASGAVAAQPTHPEETAPAAERAATFPLDIVPIEATINLNRNQTSPFVVVVQDQHGRRIDISEDTIQFNAWDADEASQIAKANAKGQHIDPTHGRTRFTLSPTDFSTIATDDQVVWTYEIRRAYSGGEVILMHGDLISEVG